MLWIQNSFQLSYIEIYFKLIETKNHKNANNSEKIIYKLLVTYMIIIRFYIYFGSTISE